MINHKFNRYYYSKKKKIFTKILNYPFVLVITKFHFPFHQEIHKIESFSCIIANICKIAHEE